eukprot:m.204133 g.204133  ORF g.204133 m.204133 type:complete len:276 (+) comp16881_c1_seq4:19-846(+)
MATFPLTAPTSESYSMYPEETAPTHAIAAFADAGESRHVPILILSDDHGLTYFATLVPFKNLRQSGIDAQCVLLLRHKVRQWLMTLDSELTCPWCNRSSKSLYELVMHIDSMHPRFLVTFEIRKLEFRITLSLCETPPIHSNAVFNSTFQRKPEIDEFAFLKPAQCWFQSSDHAQEGLADAAQHYLLSATSGEAPRVLLPSYIGHAWAYSSSPCNLMRFNNKGQRRTINSQRLSSLQRYMQNSTPCEKDDVAVVYFDWCTCGKLKLHRLFCWNHL